MQFTKFASDQVGKPCCIPSSSDLRTGKGLGLWGSRRGGGRRGRSMSLARLELSVRGGHGGSGHGRPNPSQIGAGSVGSGCHRRRLRPGRVGGRAYMTGGGSAAVQCSGTEKEIWAHSPPKGARGIWQVPLPPSPLSRVSPLEASKIATLFECRSLMT